MKNKVLLIVSFIVGAFILLGLGIGAGYLFFNNNKKCEVKERIKEVEKIVDNTDYVISLDGKDMITYYDIYDMNRKSKVLGDILLEVDKKILEDKYKDKIDEAEDYTSSMMEQLESYYGDDLLNTIEYYTSYSTVDAYKEYTYVEYLRNLAIIDYAKTKIKDKEIKKYYDDVLKEDIKLSHILVSFNSDLSTSEEQEAKEKIEDIINTLKSADDIEKTFKELAKKYSEDTKTKENGGDLGFVNSSNINYTYSSLLDEAYKLKDGEYSNSAIKTEAGYHVILRVDTKNKASLDVVADSIRETLSKDYITNNPECNIIALQELRKDYNLEFKNKELEEDYREYINNVKESYNHSN